MPSKLAARSNSSLNSLRVRLSLSQQKISGDTSRTSQLHQRRNNLSRETAIMGTTKNKRTRSKESEAVSRPTKRQATNASTTLNEAPTQKLDVYVFGSGESGELGLGHLKRNGKAPTNVKRPRLNDLLDAKTVGVVQLDVGGMHTVALTYDNRIVTWGVNDLGALGRDTTWVAPTKDANVDSESSDDDGDDSGIWHHATRPYAKLARARCRPFSLAAASRASSVMIPALSLIVRHLLGRCPFNQRPAGWPMLPRCACIRARTPGRRGHRARMR